MLQYIVHTDLGLPYQSELEKIPLTLPLALKVGTLHIHHYYYEICQTPLQRLSDKYSIILFVPNNLVFNLIDDG